MFVQCAGCGAVFENGQDPAGDQSPRPYGCCAECNKSTFRSREREVITSPSGAEVVVLKDVPADSPHGTSAQEPAE